MLSNEYAQSFQLFDQIKDGILNFDPVYWAEKNLTIEKNKFDLSGAWKPFADIYRYIGISALSPTALPLVFVKSRQVGGTVMAGVLELFFMDNFGENRPMMRGIHAFPTIKTAESYSKIQFEHMIVNSRDLGIIDKNNKRVSYLSTKYNKLGSNVSLKYFHNQNHLWIDSTGLTGDRLRGKTADFIFFDEVQDITTEAINNSLPMLNQAKWGRTMGGIQVYFGTPKKKGTAFYDIWMQSTQNHYYLGCENCKQHFPFYIYGSDSWEQVWIKEFVVQCSLCGHQQDKREATARGKWVGLDPNENPRIQYMGFHINQLYMPTATKEIMMSKKPENSATITERGYRNEVIGEFFDGDSSPITLEEIRESCGVSDRNFIASIPQQEKLVVMGIDFGLQNAFEQKIDPAKFTQSRVRGEQGSSFTAIVILIEEQPGLFFVARAELLEHSDPKHKKARIDYLMRTYNVHLCVGDIGFSNDLSWELNKMYGNKYIASRASPKINDHIRFSERVEPPEIQFEKDYYYDEMIQYLKKGMIKFPLGPKAYDDSYWLMEHCSNLELKAFMSSAGVATVRYVKNGCTDGFAALLNAYLGYKYIATEGFTKLNPLLLREKEAKINSRASVVTGYIPLR